MRDKSNFIRTFVAIPLPNHIKRFLSRVQSEFRSTRMSATWPDPARFHLTLKFLGATPEERVTSIQSVMAKFSGKYPDLTLKVQGAGVFPNACKARVVWSGIQGHTRRLKQLATDLDRNFQAIGIPAESRPFFPHITLARIKKPVRPDVLLSLIYRFENEKSSDFTADRLGFYKSRLTANGAVHTSLFEIRLNR